ncbi:hypothetical protein TNCV_1203121 [Trichonephila clavipes]|nr:hypothetical protein TNCV_1203121 [Trichonephila clavipes]
MYSTYKGMGLLKKAGRAASLLVRLVKGEDSVAQCGVPPPRRGKFHCCPTAFSPNMLRAAVAQWLRYPTMAGMS